MRYQNTNRKCSASDDGPKPKRLRLQPEKQKHVYATLVTDCEDEVSLKRNQELLKKEFAKAKPKPDVVRDLISRTLRARRDAVMGSYRPEELREQYPHLSKANYVRIIHPQIYSTPSLDMCWHMDPPNWEPL